MNYKKAVEKMTACGGGKNDIREIISGFGGIHTNWGDEIHGLLPDICLGGWGDRYTGATIEYYGKRYFLSLSDIENAAIESLKKNRSLSKKEIAGWGSKTVDSSAGGRLASLGLI